MFVQIHSLENDHCRFMTANMNPSQLLTQAMVHVSRICQPDCCVAGVK